MTKREIITFVISYLVAIIVVAVSIFVGQIPTQDQTIKLFFILVLPIICFLIADKITSFVQSRSEHEELTSKILQSIPSTDLFISFPDSNAAFDYILNAIENATEIRNTRISINKDAVSSIHDKQQKTDEKIKKLLKNGLHYSIVVSGKHADDIGKFQSFVDNIHAKGQFRGNILEDASFPIVNFIIIKHSDSEELLMGWAVKSNWDHSRPIFLIREKRIVDYFIVLHDQLLSQ